MDSTLKSNLSVGLPLDLAAISELCADFSGAELEQVVVGGLHRAYALSRELETADLRRVAQDLVPLFKTYEEQIKALAAGGEARRTLRRTRFRASSMRVPSASLFW